MNTYIALLRGINVSGKNIIKMDALRATLVNVGLQDVQTYIQSGNVVFRYDDVAVSFLQKLIENSILEDFGFQPPVLVIECSQLESIYNQIPYLKAYPDQLDKLHITFLSAIPSADLIEHLKTSIYSPDEFFIIGNAVYLYCPEGYGNTKLTNTFFEKKLKVQATTRNLNTILQLLNMAR
jgi:uncharacterized protein (DUF1697 family)